MNEDLNQTSTPDQTNAQPDVLIIGGALAGGATAILLLKQNPQLRVLIVERSVEFTKRVGEATVEISAYFLCRVLGLTQYLNQNHLMKQGMRFWFYNDQARNISDCSELGGRYLARIASFQVDRSTLDQEVLDRAVAMGATLLRPAMVEKVELRDGQRQKATLAQNGKKWEIEPRWVVDGSGVACHLARANGWWRANEAHPTAAAWARWKGVKDWDGLELAQKYPDWSARCFGIRGTATNHFMGQGWWAWCIPLKGGEMSVGAVIDQRIVKFPTEGKLEDRLRTFLCQHPAARELLEGAECVAGDVHWRRNLPYYSTRFAGDGFCLVGDAAAFIDPFYSPGLDWMSFSSSLAARTILKERSGACVKMLVAEQDKMLGESYRNWFTALYQDKYEYFGDYELMNLAFKLDVALYYLGPARQPFMRGFESFYEPFFTTPLSKPAHWLMSKYNRRLARIGRRRRLQGTLGMMNVKHVSLIDGYTFRPSNVIRVLRLLARFCLLEAREGWRSWFDAESVPMPIGATMQKTENA